LRGVNWISHSFGDDDGPRCQADTSFINHAIRIMKDTMLGHTGLGVSRICLGCVIHGVAGLGAHMPEKMGVKAAHVPNAVTGF
jgi:hypothetical protein